ncbi:MAG: hypothetical protein J1E63_00180, partial [Muribaculaceae bacterium]|nr:hypothetical protein [Muribaculaceae bacterium]
AAEAIAAINAMPGSDPMTLLVAPGVYWLDDPDDPQIRNAGNGTPYGTTISVDTLAIIGLNPDPVNTVFASNRGQTQGAIGNFTMIKYVGKSLEVHNMTLGNYCNIDLDYPLDPSKNRPRRANAIVQAQLGICHGTDRLFSTNCRYVSRLNLCPLVGSRRSLYKDCHFESTDDALTGSAVYLDCHFTFHSSKPFYNTPPTGAVFLNCDIDLLNTGAQYLTKVPGPVTLIDTRFHSCGATPPTSLQWTRDPSASVCYQCNVTLDGKPVTMDPERPELTVDLSGRKALDAYRLNTQDGRVVYNIPSLVGGDDNWDPLGIRDDIVSIAGSEALSLPVAIIFDRRSADLAAKDDTANVTPLAVRWGNYTANVQPTNIDWTYPSTVTLEATGSGHRYVMTSQNHLPNRVDAYVTATVADGLKGRLHTVVAPYLTAAPTFTSAPTISYDKKAKAMTVSYSLDKEGDNSHIVWYRYTRPDLADTIPVMHGRASSARSYTLTVADAGHSILARVAPEADGTKVGEYVTASSLPVKSSMTTKKSKTETLSTTFADLPVSVQPVIKRGAWTLDCYKPAETAEFDWQADNYRPAWYYGYGTDGATGIGLAQATRGARAFYTPMTEKSNHQSITVDLEPCKSAGQGFGSATGQFMDIYIGFNPERLSGYALRIRRTPGYDHAVVFSLVEYRDGTVTPLTDPVASSCFRTTCTVDLSIADGILTARASSTAPAISSSAPDVLDSVDLSVPVTIIPGTALGFQHTGTTGASATLITRLNALWH